MAAKHYGWETSMGGTCLTIIAPDGTDVAFLQGEEAAELADELDNADDEEIIDAILSEYDEIGEDENGNP